MSANLASSAGKTAVVTGASRGIGKEIALRLSRSGYTVVLMSNEMAQLRQTAEQIEKTGHRAITICLDVKSSNDIQNAIAGVEREHGPISILVNCAGIAFFGGIEICTEEQWQQTIDTNLSGYFRLIKAVLPGMKTLGSGAIINMSSIWGKQGAAAMTAYSVSKFGVEGLTASLAQEVHAFGIKVSSIVLDKVDTDFRELMKTQVNFSAGQRERMLSVFDVADAVDFILASSSRCLPESITLKAWRF